MLDIPLCHSGAYSFNFQVSVSGKCGPPHPPKKYIYIHIYINIYTYEVIGLGRAVIWGKKRAMLLKAKPVLLVYAFKTC